MRLVQAVTGKEALSEVKSRKPDLVILDLGLPDIDGLEVTRQLRQWTQVPIIVLSVRGSEKDKVAALDAGADDYLTKPFGTEELLARIRVVWRHQSQSADEPIFEIGNIMVDLCQQDRKGVRAGNPANSYGIRYSESAGKSRGESYDPSPDSARSLGRTIW